MRRRPAFRPATAPASAGRWFAAFTVASLLLLLTGESEAVRSLRLAAAAVIDPARDSVAALGRSVVEVGERVIDDGGLRRENADLRSALAAARQEATELREAGRENAELRRLLGVAGDPDLEVLPVRVTVRDASNFVAEVIVDAGTAEGVREGMSVVAGTSAGRGALVGTVVEATRDSARVRLVVDDRSVVVGQDLETRALGELRGQAAGGLVLVNVPLADPVEVGDTIISAHLTVDDDESLHPAGLLVGMVVAVEADDNAVTQTAYVEPAVDADDFERLLVVLDYERE